MFIIYFALAIIAAVLTWFYVVETKGLPVEEISALFGEVVVHLTADGHGTIEDKSGAEQVENASEEAAAKA